MSNEVLFALVAGLAAGFWKLIKEAPEIRRGGRKELLDEFLSAETILQKLNCPNMHPLVRERGLQALAGNKAVKSADIAYLIHINAGDRTLRHYLVGRGSLYRNGLTLSDRFEFKRYLRTKFRRTLMKRLYLGLYLVCFISSFISILVAIAQYGRGEPFTPMAFGILLLISAAVSAISSIEIECAELVVQAQEYEE